MATNPNVDGDFVALAEVNKVRGSLIMKWNKIGRSRVYNSVKNSHDPSEVCVKHLCIHHTSLDLFTEPYRDRKEQKQSI